jgi:hypothetical protein
MKSLFSLLTRTVRKPTTMPPQRNETLTEAESDKVAAGGGRLGGVQE